MKLRNRFAHRTRLVIAAIVTTLGAVWVLASGGAVVPWVVLGCGVVMIVVRASAVTTRRGGSDGSAAR
jgi:hypothetical protein